MFAVRVLYTQSLPCPVKLINFARLGTNLIDALPFKIGVVERSIHQEPTRSERGDDLREVERTSIWRVIKQPRHVTNAGPPTDVAVLVIPKRIETATAHHDFNSIVKGRG